MIAYTPARIIKDFVRPQTFRGMRKAKPSWPGRPRFVQRDDLRVASLVEAGRNVPFGSYSTVSARIIIRWLMSAARKRCAPELKDIGRTGEWQPRTSNIIHASRGSVDVFRDGLLRALLSSQRCSGHGPPVSSARSSSRRAACIGHSSSPTLYTACRSFERGRRIGSDVETTGEECSRSPPSSPRLLEPRDPGASIRGATRWSKYRVSPSCSLPS